MIKKLITALLCVSMLFGCSTASPAEHTITFTAMNTYMTIKITGGSDDLLKDIQAMVETLDATVSTTNENSEIYRLNEQGQVAISADTYAIVSQALPICQSTDGALDLSIYPIVKAWGFTTDDYHVPAAKTIKALLKKVDYRQITLTKTSLSLKEGMAIDLGSVTKGYTTNLIAAYLKDHNISSAIIDFGGNVHTLGHKADGSQWLVGIKSPETKDAAAAIKISNLAVITSGGYERYFEEDGHLYWHIIDPHTGYPADNGVVSMTIIGEDGLKCDALSTSLFVKGTKDAIAYWKAHQDFDMVIMTDDKMMYVTSPIADSLTLMDTSYTLEVITND